MKKKEYTLGEITLETLTEDECVQENCDELCERWMDVIDCELDINQVNENNCEQLIEAFSVVMRVLNSKSDSTTDLEPYNRAIELGAELANKMLEGNLNDEAKRVLLIMAAGLSENVRLEEDIPIRNHRFQIHTVCLRRFREQLADAKLMRNLDLLMWVAKIAWTKQPGTFEELLAITKGMLAVAAAGEEQRIDNCLTKGVERDNEKEHWETLLWWANQAAATIRPEAKEYENHNENTDAVNYVLTTIGMAFEEERDAEKATPAETLYLANVYKRSAMLAMATEKKNYEAIICYFTLSIEHAKRVNCADTETINLYERFLRGRFPSFEKDFIKEKRKELKGIRRLCWQA